MNYTITTTLSEKFIKFLDSEAKNKKISKKMIIEKGLEYYRKNELEKQVKEGFEKRFSEYKDINSDFYEIQNNSIKD